MSRPLREVVPGLPHHVTQRGNHGKILFDTEEMKAAYMRILKRECEKYECAIAAYCFMDNHVHMILVPKTKESLSMAVGRTAYSYCRLVNEIIGDKGSIWDGRFWSAALSTREYQHRALVYVESNPVRAGLCPTAADWIWSSAKAHTTGKDWTGVLDMSLFVGHTCAEWVEVLAQKEDKIASALMYIYTRRGRMPDSVMMA